MAKTFLVAILLCDSIVRRKNKNMYVATREAGTADCVLGVQHMFARFPV